MRSAAAFSTSGLEWTAGTARATAIPMRDVRNSTGAAGLEDDVATLGDRQKKAR